jgi:hypothetical protein
MIYKNKLPKRTLTICNFKHRLVGQHFVSAFSCFESKKANAIYALRIQKEILQNLNLTKHIQIIHPNFSKKKKNPGLPNRALSNTK